MLDLEFAQLSDTGRVREQNEDALGYVLPATVTRIHSQGWVAELIEAAGGQFLGIPGTHTTAEAVAAAEPDVLLFAWCGAGDRVPLDRVIAQRNWHHLKAVRNKNVFCIPDEYLNTPAITLLDGLACIAHALHPQIFLYPQRLIRLS